VHPGWTRPAGSRQFAGCRLRRQVTPPGQDHLATAS
jgi:hypothetical protein